MTLGLPSPAESGAGTSAVATGFLGSELVSLLDGARIPSLPQILLRIIALAEDDEKGLGELADLISRDPGLCARVLAVANSPALRRGREMRRIEDCLAVLGTSLVRTMAACLAVQAAFDDVPSDLSGFWVHSIEVAELARSIAVATRKANPDEAYLAGLLHDTGQLLLLTSVSDYTGLLVLAGDEELLCDIEMRAFGAHHGAVGAWLVDQWRMDSFLADAILFHHESLARVASGDPLTRILWAAHSATSATEGLFSETAKIVGLGADKLAALRTAARQRTDDIAAALGIVVSVGASSFPQPTGMVTMAPSAAMSPLVDAAHGMAYIQPLQENLFGVSSDDELLLTVRESARILFGLSRLGLLLVDPQGAVLSGSGIGGQSSQLNRLEISLTTAPCLAVRAMAERKTICSLEDETSDLSLADIQLLRALGSDGMLCVPLASRQKCSGVIVFGITGMQWLRGARQLNLLPNFARIVATGIAASREARSREQATEAAVAGRYQQRARQMAHEAGNPLALIRNYLKLLEQKLVVDGPVPRELAILDEEISRVAGIIHGLSDHDAATAPTSELRTLIEELLAGYGKPLFADRRIELKLDLPAQDVMVAARRDQLIQILLNLWKNVSEAMPDGGSFRIAVTADIYEGSRRLVEIRLQDSGPGLPPGLWEKLIAGDADPASGSRGLGLGIVLELVAAMSGRIACASQPGRGTLFSIHIPGVA